MYPKIATRIIIIKENKLLLVNNLRDNFYYLPGGKIEYKETILECIQRELNEETGMNVNVEFKKIVYLSEYINNEKNKHKVEIYVWVEIDKYKELEGVLDPSHDGTDHLTWVDIYNLPDNLYPKEIYKRLADDYKSGFKGINVPFY